MELIDTHAHIDMLEGYAEYYVAQAAENNVSKIIIPGIEAEGFPKIIEIAERFKNIFFELGLFPTEALKWNDNYPELIKKFAQNPKCAGIGEIGLDYHWDKSFIDKQKEVFIKQIEIANSLNLPITVHDRDAHEDVLEIIDKYNDGSEIIFHCFSGNVDFMKEITKRGYYLAIGGVVTFKKAEVLKEVAREVPLDKLLLETDAPYLAPVPFRGKENQPAYIKYTAEEIAKIKNIPVETIAEATTKNAEKVFRL